MKLPVPLMVPPLATTDHVGVIATTLPLASLPVATNCCVPLTAIVTGLGVTVIVANGPALLTTATEAVAVRPPTVAWIVL